MKVGLGTDGLKCQFEAVTFEKTWQQLKKGHFQSMLFNQFLTTQREQIMLKNYSSLFHHKGNISTERSLRLESSLTWYCKTLPCMIWWVTDLGSSPHSLTLGQYPLLLPASWRHRKCMKKYVLSIFSKACQFHCYYYCQSYFAVAEIQL